MAKNIAASVRQKLLNKAQVEKRTFQELLQYYAMERFLYRLSQSNHNRCFTLKGALMLWVMQGPNSRPTRDIDMLGQTSNEPKAILAQIREVIAVKVVEDGLSFDSNTLKVEVITADADYQGLRVTFTGALDKARIPMQLDIGFGDTVFPFPTWRDFPALLDFPSARIQCYTPESSIAEKFQAMVNLGELNSRNGKPFLIALASRTCRRRSLRLLRRWLNSLLLSWRKILRRSSKRYGTRPGHGVGRKMSSSISQDSTSEPYRSCIGS